MGNWQEIMRGLKAQDIIHSQQLQSSAEDRIKAEEERRGRLKALMGRLGVVRELEGINQEIWDSLGAIEFAEDINSLDGKKIGRSIEASLTHKRQWYSEEKREIVKKVFGSYQNHGGGRYSMMTETVTGWHAKPIAWEIVGTKVKFSSDSQKVKIERKSGSDIFVMYVHDDSVNLSPVYSGKNFRLETGAKLNDPGIDSVLKTGDMNQLAVLFRNTDAGIFQAHEHLALALAWMNKERSVNGRLPQDFRREEDTNLARLQTQIGKIVYYHGCGPKDLK